jgi:hypothetical protein
MPGQGKRPSRKSPVTKFWGDGPWTVGHGKLIAGPGRPALTARLFKVVGEKLPIEAINAVRKHLSSLNVGEQGVYIAHDSMGYARYAGRGRIFNRLKARVKESVLEIKYFSFYVVRDKPHEREIETLLIRIAAPMLFFNERKKRLNLSPGNVRDYEPRTLFVERHYKRGRKRKGRNA